MEHGAAAEAKWKHSIFVSYSHRDEAWKDRLLARLGPLADPERTSVWHDRLIGAGTEWFEEIRAAMERATVAVCLVSPSFLTSEFCTREEVPYLLERRQSVGLRLLPVLVHPCAWEPVVWLSGLQLLPRDGKSVSADYGGREDVALAEVAAEIEKAVRNPAYRPVVPPSRWAPLDAGRIETGRLPVTGYELFGRQGELAQLDLAWSNYGTNVFALVGWGGVGKSTLVGKWLERLSADNYRDARRVFGWSFHSQGSRERVAAADDFVGEALRWFGDPDPAAGSPWDKGERLAALVRQEKTLLVLDGLEPLQSESDLDPGRIKDPALATLLTELAAKNDGLCVVTTRERVADLEEWPAAASQVNLERLTPSAGGALLRVRGVRARDEDLERISREFGYDALALSLLSSFLRDLPGDPVATAAAIPKSDVARDDGRYAGRVLLAYEQHFGEGPELELLRVLGLFDRPATWQEIGALRAQPGIEGLSAHLASLSEADVLRLLWQLRDRALVAPENREAPDLVDAHPVVREHFAGRLRKQLPAAWRDGNSRLYDHLKHASDAFPETVERMLPLYAAVAHAFRAGRYDEALDDVYWPRIQRGREDFSITRLGAQGLTLAVLAGLFEVRWRQLVPPMRANRQRAAAITSAASQCLRTLGRRDEAEEAAFATFLVDLQLAEATGSAQNVLNAGIDANALGELSLLSGPLSRARASALKAKELVESTPERFWWLVTRTTLGEIEHKAGRLGAAEERFVEAERIEAELHSEGKRLLPILYARQGFRYCSYLLAVGRWDEVLGRASLTVRAPDNWPIDTALDHLSLGVAHLRRGSFPEADAHLALAVDGARAVGDYEWIGESLLARSELRWCEGDREQALSDLDRAKRLASRAGLRLLELDCRIAEAQVLEALGERERARQSASAARELLERTEYHLRDADVERVEAMVSSSLDAGR